MIRQGGQVRGSGGRKPPAGSTAEPLVGVCIYVILELIFCSKCVKICQIVH